MKDYNKRNLIFLAVIGLSALTVFFAVVMLTYVGKAGLWSTPLPVVALGYGVYCFIKRYLPKS